MLKRIWAFALSFLFISSIMQPALAVVLGPASSYEELASLFAAAQEGDIITITGDFSAQDSPALTTQAAVHIQSDGSAVIRGLKLEDASLSLSDISLADTLTISGTSHIQLGKNTSVSGAAGKTGLSFSGNGTLIIEGGCSIEGGHGASGVSIRHRGGEFYGSIEGDVRGGSGSSGGAGVEVSPLQNGGALMVTGSIKGGSGDGMGGHALNLYELSGNAYITVVGHLQGGSGAVGGNGIQIVSASDQVIVGVSGQTRGGDGLSYGGDALILMNAQDSSSFHISGYFAGGNAIGENAQPGTSLQLVGNSASLRARIDNCILEDGRRFLPTPQPTVTPIPTPEVTPLPQITPPTDELVTMITPETAVKPVIETDALQIDLHNERS